MTDYYHVAQPRRALQSHAKRVDHVVVNVPAYGIPGLTACGLEFGGDWDMERIADDSLKRRIVCGNCVKKSDRWRKI